MRMMGAAVFLFLLPLSVLGQQPKEPGAKEVRGWTLAVIGVERQLSWTIPIVGSRIYPTRAGSEFLIVHLRADPIAPRTTKEPMSWDAEDIKKISVATADGTTYARDTGELIAGADYHVYSEFFSVPKGPPVTSLSFLGTTFDLTNAKQRSRDEAIKAQAVAGQTSKAQPTKEAVIKDYKPGETYGLVDVVALNAEGNKLTVELVSSTDATTTGTAIEVKLKVTGEAQVLGFSWGQENSAITLVVGEKRVAASKTWFTDEVVATFPKATLVSRLTVHSPKGPLTYNTTERPLVVRFQVPAELSKAAKQLELKEVMIGGPHYSLIVKLEQ